MKCFLFSASVPAFMMIVALMILFAVNLVSGDLELCLWIIQFSLLSSLLTAQSHSLATSHANKLIFPLKTIISVLQLGKVEKWVLSKSFKNLKLVWHFVSHKVFLLGHYKLPSFQSQKFSQKEKSIPTKMVFCGNWEWTEFRRGLSVRVNVCVRKVEMFSLSLSGHTQISDNPFSHHSGIELWLHLSIIQCQCGHSSIWSISISQLDTLMQFKIYILAILLKIEKYVWRERLRGTRVEYSLKVPTNIHF